MGKFDKTILNNISKRLTKLLRNEIIEQEKIATGKMLKTTNADVFSANEINGEVVFQIESTDYFKFVDGKFHIVDKGLNIKNNILKDNTIIRMFEDLYVGYLENVLDEKIPPGPAVI